MDWDKYRRADGTIDLIAAFRSQNEDIVGEAAFTFLERIEAWQRIRSRQVAAHTLATAKFIMLTTYDIDL